MKCVVNVATKTILGKLGSVVRCSAAWFLCILVLIAADLHSEQILPTQATVKTERLAASAYISTPAWEYRLLRTCWPGRQHSP